MNQRPVLPPAFQQLTLNKQRHPVANVGDHQFADRRAVGTFGYVHVGRPSRDQPGGRRGARPDREHRQWPKPRTTPHVQFRHLHRHTGTMPLTQVSKAPPARPLPGSSIFGLSERPIDRSDRGLLPAQPILMVSSPRCRGRECRWRAGPRLHHSDRS